MLRKCGVAEARLGTLGEQRQQCEIEAFAPGERHGGEGVAKIGTRRRGGALIDAPRIHAAAAAADG